MIIQGNFVFPLEIKKTKILIKNNLIKKISDDLGNPDKIFSEQELIFPSFVDIHVHCRDGSFSQKEDFTTASYAALNGGVGALMDMPNNIKCTDLDSYLDKVSLTQKKSKIPIIPYYEIRPNTVPLDIIVPYKLYHYLFKDDELEKTLSLFKEEYVSFHCEYTPNGDADSEIRSVAKILELTEKFNLKTIICHISTAEGLKLCKQTSAKVEVTPHHLYFNTENTKNNKYFKVNPPIRDRKDQEYLLEALIQDQIDFLASDHAPHLMSEKNIGSSGLPHLDTYGNFVSYLIKEKKVSLSTIHNMCCSNPGKFFNNFSSEKYGELKVDYSAQFTVLDFSSKHLVTKNGLKTKCCHSPFIDLEFPATVKVI